MSSKLFVVVKFLISSERLFHEDSQIHRKDRCERICLWEHWTNRSSCAVVEPTPYRTFC